MTTRQPHGWIVAVAMLATGACGDRAQAPVPVPASAAAPVTAATAAPAAAARPGAAVKPPVEGPAKPRAVQAKAPEVPFEGRRIALVHTANVIGELEPCG